MTTKDPDAVLTEIQSELAAMLDPLDIPRSWSGRELNEYEAKRAHLSRRIGTIRSMQQELAEVVPLRIAAEEWQTHLVEWRQTLADELAALPTAYTALELGKRRNLQLSVQTIDRGLSANQAYGHVLETLRLGELMREAGYTAAPAVEGQVFGKLPWSGSVPEVELRIKDLSKRSEYAQKILDDALLSDAEREAKAKDDKARRDARNAMPTRKKRGDGTQYDKYPDGRIVEIEVTT